MPGGVAELCIAVADHGGRLPCKTQKRRTRRGGKKPRSGKPGRGHDTGVLDGAETEPDIPQLRPETDAEPDPGQPLWVRLKNEYIVYQHSGQLTSADDEPDIAEPGHRRRRINRREKGLRTAFLILLRFFFYF